MFQFPLLGIPIATQLLCYTHSHKQRGGKRERDATLDAAAAAVEFHFCFSECYSIWRKIDECFDLAWKAKFSYEFDWSRKHVIQQDQIKLMMLLILLQRNNSRNIRIIPFDVDFWMEMFFFSAGGHEVWYVVVLPIFTWIVRIKNVVYGIMLS